MDAMTLAAPVEVAAVQLLGARLVSEVDGGRSVVTISEVEAYGGADDPASHAHRGRTATNGSMFARPGTLYVYRSYGIHLCGNVVVGPPGEPGAVLIRAGVPYEGEELMRQRRGRVDHLTDGPGKLGQALGLALSHDGLDLLSEASPVWLEPGQAPDRVVATPRIGISRAVERPWRFVGVRD